MYGGCVLSPHSLLTLIIIIHHARNAEKGGGVLMSIILSNLKHSFICPVPVPDFGFRIPDSRFPDFPYSLQHYTDSSCRHASNDTLTNFDFGPATQISVSLLWGKEREQLYGSTVYLTNRFHVAVRLFSNRSQMTSKCGKNKKVAHEA